jgi:hypothetical protein
MDIPIDCRDSFPKVLLCLLQFQAVHVTVNAARFFECGNPSAHPSGAPGELIKGREDGPM